MEKNKDFLTIQTDLQHKIISTEWSSAMSGDEFREKLLYVRKLIKKDQLENWLVYAPVFYPPVVLDQRFTIETLFPFLLKTSLKKIAFVLPGDHFIHMLAQSTIEKVYRQYNPHIKIECFSRIEHARHWLLTSEETEGALSA